jgi:hypothetical protein
MTQASKKLLEEFAALEEGDRAEVLAIASALCLGTARLAGGDGSAARIGSSRG